MELETIACDFCGSTTNKSVVVRPDGLSVEECERCGLAFLNPRPRPDQIVNLYSRDYFKKDSCGDLGYGYEDYFSGFNQRYLKNLTLARFEIVREFFNPENKIVLEIGCASGDFCDLISKHGAIVEGLDLSLEAVKIASLTYPKIRFHHGDMSDLSTGKKFDAIFAFEVIEHVQSPKRFIAEVAKRLKTGGLLFISTPNYECAKTIGTSNWVGFRSSFEHLYFFSKSSLERYCRETGLEVVNLMTGLGSGFANLKQQRLKHLLLTRIPFGKNIFQLLKKIKQSISSTRVQYFKNRSDLNNLFLVIKACVAVVYGLTLPIWE